MTDISTLQAFKLTALDRSLSIVDQGKPTFDFQRTWEQQGQAIEGAIQLLADALSAVINAQDAADAANAAADAANAAADSVTAQSSLATSYVDKYVSPLISANSSGNVTIANHDRVYGDGTTVSVIGGVVVTGLSNPDVARIYYDDPTRAGGAVSYQFTVDAAVAAQVNDRHSVGAVEIPAAGTQDGGGVLPPGYALP